MSHRSVKCSMTIYITNDSGQSTKKPIVSTQYVEWATAQFARGDESGGAPFACAEEAAVGGAGGGAGGGPPADCESRASHECVWRRARNRSIRREARGERSGTPAGMAPVADALGWGRTLLVVDIGISHTKCILNTNYIVDKDDTILLILC